MFHLVRQILSESQTKLANSRNELCRKKSDKSGWRDKTGNTTITWEVNNTAKHPIIHRKIHKLFSSEITCFVPRKAESLLFYSVISTLH